MPRGFFNKEERNPLNYRLAEWQQAKHLDDDPNILKLLFESRWTVSDSKNSFGDALNECGYALTKADRRGFGAVNYQGEVFSLSQWTGLKTNKLKDRLSNPDALPTVDVVKRDKAEQMTARLGKFKKQTKKEATMAWEPLGQRKQALVNAHRKERQDFHTKQTTGEKEETKSL